MEIYYAWSQLESYVDISLLLGQLAYRLPHPTLLLHTHFLTMFPTS